MLGTPFPSGSPPSLSSRDRRALVLGGAVVVAALAGARGWPVYARWADAEQQAARTTLAAASRATQAVTTRRAHADSVRARLERLGRAETGLVAGGSAATAAAELGAAVRGQADDAGITLGPVGVSAEPAEAAPYVVVRATAEGTGILGAVTSLLDGLEAGPVRLAVRELSVERPTSVTAFAPALAGGQEAAPVLRVRFTVEGLARATARTAVSRTAAARVTNADDDAEETP